MLVVLFYHLLVAVVADDAATHVFVFLTTAAELKP
jgi:hypothetical protein